MNIIEVSPRDGLQNESVALATDAKLALIRRAVDAGIGHVEVASFVSPARVPQMADAEAVCAALPQRDGVTYSGLVLNTRGFERARAAGLPQINVVVVVTETFSQRNQGCSTAEAVTAWSEIAVAAREAGITPTVTLAASFGCPFEGEVPLARLCDIAERVVDAAIPHDLSLADTIGVGVPRDVTERITAVRRAVGDVTLRAHFHNTRNTGIANAMAAVEVGVDALDASLGGIGGCPFAPRATGNIATEDLVYMLERSGIATGISLDALIAAVPWIEERLGKTAPGMLAKAGGFPA